MKRINLRHPFPAFVARWPFRARAAAGTSRKSRDTKQAAVISATI